MWGPHTYVLRTYLAHQSAPSPSKKGSFADVNPATISDCAKAHSCLLLSQDLLFSWSWMEATCRNLDSMPPSPPLPPWRLLLRHIGIYRARRHEQDCHTFLFQTVEGTSSKWSYHLLLHFFSSTNVLTELWQFGIEGLWCHLATLGVRFTFDGNKMEHSLTHYQSTIYNDDNAHHYPNYRSWIDATASGTIVDVMQKKSFKFQSSEMVKQKLKVKPDCAQSRFLKSKCNNFIVRPFPSPLGHSSSNTSFSAPLPKGFWPQPYQQQQRQQQQQQQQLNTSRCVATTRGEVSAQAQKLKMNPSLPSSSSFSSSKRQPRIISIVAAIQATTWYSER